MCLSTLYDGAVDEGKVLMEDASHVTIKNGKIMIMDILGDEKELDGYKVEELDFLKHYAVLKKV
jgi:predicted RNA-binding protein